MAGLATKETNTDPKAVIESVENPQKVEDGKILLKTMEEITGNKPKVWGENGMIGYGKYKYKRKGGKEEFEWFNVGFAVRKSKITVYLTTDLDQEGELLSKIGKYKSGRGCLYINKLADIDMNILSELIDKSKSAQWGH